MTPSERRRRAIAVLAVLAAAVFVVGAAGGAKRAPATAVAAGMGHNCAITKAGGVRCWGLNDEGQLGDGTTVNRPTPVDVTGLTSGVTAIAAGAFHTCALTGAGGVKCWGVQRLGQLGDGTHDPAHRAGRRLRPHERRDGDRGGAYHTCALTIGGGVKCWGDNASASSATARPPTAPRRSTWSGLDERRGRRSRRRRAHLRAHDRRRREVLGRERRRPARRRHDHRPARRPVDVIGLDAAASTAIGAGDYHTCAL